MHYSASFFMHFVLLGLLLFVAHDLGIVKRESLRRTLFGSKQRLFLRMFQEVALFLMGDTYCACIIFK